ncbi:DMT family transporter [Thalassobaculum sp.]|uniref:DMT family transporter n=1 Tax=Thalassobaculum sp. TaxID=2022740 RepID=UPI0032EE6EC6
MTDSTATAPTDGRTPILAVALLAMIAVLWGFNWPIMKIGLAEIPPWVFRAGASIVSCAGLFLISAVAGHSLRVPPGQWRAVILGGILNITFFNIFVAYGVTAMDAGRAGIIGYTMPLWATLIGTVVLKERLGPRAIAGLTVGLIGMALLFSVDAAVLTGSALGPLLVLAGAASWGAGTVVIKHARLTMPITVAVAWQHLIGVVPIAIVAVAWDWQHVGEWSLWPVMALLYNMLITGIICYWAYFKVVQMLPVVASTVGTLMVPVIGVFANQVIFGVTPHLVDYVALICVAVAVFLVVVRPRQS